MYNLSGFEILYKSINIIRYVLKFGYMRCSGLRWKVCKVLWAFSHICSRHGGAKKVKMSRVLSVKIDEKRSI